MGATIGYTPTVAYDPVARIVTITPLTIASQALVPGQGYRLLITTPKDASDPNGLRAIDDGTLAAPITLVFSVTAATAAVPPTVSIDFCRDIYPVINAKCSLGICHGAFSDPATPAAGLVLNPPSGVASTALGRVAQGANTGPRSVATPPSALFGEDMPIIDSSGNPSNSWMLYKMLLAVPQEEPVVDAGTSEAGSTEAGPEEGGAADAGDAGALDDAGLAEAGPGDAGSGDASPGDAGADGGAAEGGITKPPVIPPVDVSNVHAPFVWGDISATNRATLSNYILGREMPYPMMLAHPDRTTGPLTLFELERMSLDGPGRKAPSSCP